MECKQPKQDYDPDGFPLSLPFSCSSLGGTAKCSSCLFSPHHAFLITETHKSKKWEEDRGKQDARRRRESSFLPLRLSLVFSCSHYMYVLCMSREGEQTNPLCFPYPLSSFGSLSPLMEKEKRASSRRRPEELLKRKRKSETKGMERSTHRSGAVDRTLIIVSPAHSFDSLLPSAFKLPGAHG